MSEPDGLTILLNAYQTHQKYRVPFEDIHRIRHISGNSNSDVYRATIEIEGTSHSVASKELRVYGKSKGTPNAYKRLARELHIWLTKLLDEKHIIPIFRFAINPANDYPVLITKYMPNGNLREYLSVKKDFPIDFLQLISEIGDGLLYLHDNEVTHGDMTCSNILMSSDDPPKPLLTDFGLSHILNPTSMTVQLITDDENSSGTQRYMAKEMFSRDASREHFYTKISDVWAFGMTIYEIIVGKLPFYEIKHDIWVPSEVHAGKLPTWPENDAELHISLRNRGLMDKLKVVCSHCWKDRKERPEMRTVMDMLHAIDEKCNHLEASGPAGDELCTCTQDLPYT